jgi:hypothetical protein
MQTAEAEGGWEGSPGFKIQNAYVIFQHYLHLSVRAMPFHRTQKASISRAQPPPTCPRNGITLIKSITYGAE